MERLVKCLTPAVLAFFLFLSSTSNAPAQSTGAVRGTVIDDESGEPLPRASIRLEGTKYGGVSDNDGRYRISNIPTGSYTLVVTYIGFKEGRESVRIAGGSTIIVDITLESETIEGGEIVVRGSRSGQARALTRQKNADNIVNVMSEDMIERFPDPNAAEAIQRIPGISIQRDQGEGRYVLIRGMDARLNSVAINGERLPSPEGDTRQVALDVIPTDLISSIEVHKAITPEMDADAIGGAVNLITKSARDYSGRILKGKLAGGYNAIREDANYQGSITFGDRFGPDRKLGLILSANYYKTNRGSDNNEFEYDDGIIETMELRHYTVNRLRTGISGTLDYEFDDENSLYFRTIYNYFDDDEYRRRLEIQPGGDLSDGSATEGEFSRDFKDRYEAQRIVSVSAGGNHLLPILNSVDMDYNLTYSYAEEEEPDRYDTSFELETEDAGMTWSSDNDFPIFSFPTNDPNDPTKFEFKDITYEDNLTTDKDIIASVDFEAPFTINALPLTVKTGAKLRNKTKDRDNTVEVWEWDGDDDYMLDMVADDFKEDMLDDKYTLGSFQDPDKVIDHFKDNKSSYKLEKNDTREDSDVEDFEAGETVVAAYGQGKIQFGNFDLLAGLRLENTSVDYTSYQVNFKNVPDDEGEPEAVYDNTTKIEESNSYLNVFPNVHLTYHFNEDTNIKAAVTTAIARPDYESLVPYKLINRADEEIEQGNPDLEPTKAAGIDVMAEHYFRPLGIVSGGFFYKNLTDYIFPRKREISGGDFDGYEVEDWANGDTATLWGIEVNWMHQLTFLPGWANGFGVYANYTFTDSEADIPLEGEEVRSATLPGQSENMGNFAVSYEKFGFMARLSLNFHGEYIDEVGETSEEDEYYDSRTQIDLNLSQRVTDRISVFADLINLTNEPLRYYIGRTSRPRQQEYYRFWTHFGLKFNL